MPDQPAIGNPIAGETNELQKSPITSNKHLIAGLLGGLTSAFVLHPLDLVKIRFAVSDGQANSKKNYKGIANAFTTIAKEEGFRGLYKGVTPNCLGAGSSWGLYFFFYNSFKGGPGPLSNTRAAVIAGCLTTAITNPIWVVKTRLCLQYPNSGADYRYTGTWDALVKLFRKEGIPGFYRGFIPGLFGITHGAIQMTAYEEMKKFYSMRNNLPLDHKLDTIQYLVCASLSKYLAAIITYPFQVVRARLQDQHVKYEGLIDVIKRTRKREYYFGFYKGLTAYLLQVTPKVCIVFFVYETTLKTL